MLGEDFSVDVIDGVVVVTGEVDTATAPLLEANLTGWEGPLLLDLGGVTFMDSAGVGVLALQGQRRRDAGQILDVVGMSRPVRRVLEVVGLLNFFVPPEPPRPTADERPADDGLPSEYLASPQGG